MAAGMVAEPACAPTNGGKIRLPAPKNIEKNVKVMTNRWRVTSLFKVLLFLCVPATHSSKFASSVVPSHHPYAVIHSLAYVFLDYFLHHLEKRTLTDSKRTFFQRRPEIVWKTVRSG